MQLPILSHCLPQGEGKRRKARTVHPELTKFKLEKQARWVQFSLAIVPAPPVMLILLAHSKLEKRAWCVRLRLVAHNTVYPCHSACPAHLSEPLWTSAPGNPAQVDRC